jgi:hypothetical protein
MRHYYLLGMEATTMSALSHLVRGGLIVHMGN